MSRFHIEKTVCPESGADVVRVARQIPVVTPLGAAILWCETFEVSDGSLGIRRKMFCLLASAGFLGVFYEAFFQPVEIPLKGHRREQNTQIILPKLTAPKWQLCAEGSVTTKQILSTILLAELRKRDLDLE